MAWSTIRKATDEDIERVAAARQRFEKRHGITIGDLDMASQHNLDGFGCVRIGDEIVAWDHVVYLRGLWKAAQRRALRHPSADGMYYGYVGWDAP